MNMKKILKYLPFVAALVLASCTKDAPSKSKVEADFEKFTGTVPTVTISSTVEAVDPMAGTATVSLTLAGISDQLDSLSVGVLSDSNPTFANASYVKYENPADGTISLKAKVSANKHFYLRGVVAYSKGTSFSDVIEVDVPDIPFIDKVAGTYSGAAKGYWGDDYTITMQVVPDPEDKTKVLVYDLDAYFYTNGFTAAKGYNIYSGTIDEDNLRIIVDGGQPTGYVSSAQGAVILYGFDAPSPDDGNVGADIILNVNADNSTITIPNAFGVASSAGWWEIYLGGSVLTMQ